MTSAIIFPVHNALDFVQRSLPQILQTTPDSVPIVTIADACDEETLDYLHEFHLRQAFPHGYTERRTFFCENPKQQLFTRTVNRGLRISHRLWQPDVMVVVNTDCDLHNGWYDYLMQAMSIHPRLGMIGYRDSPDMERWKKFAFTEIQKPEYITGHCMALRTRALEEVGVLSETDTDGREDPTLAPYLGQAHIGSERLWCWRAMERGWQAMWCNGPLVFHEAGKSWGHDLNWLHNFKLDPLWDANDTLLDYYDSEMV